ncbi:hypothetical protein HK096_005187 [Nowakowskiella sp. JEL0078]|nr:hypothetical protein HK096_005187 [Nowakowskiella sp. JEL0078]
MIGALCFRIEASLGDMGFTPQPFLDAINELSLDYILGIYTSWQDYEGPYIETSLSQHIQQLEKQLLIARTFTPKPIWINIHGGDDSWDSATTRKFFTKAVAVIKDLDLDIKVCGFETHRTRCFYSPWNTLPILKEFKEVNLTLDFSHWVVVCERLLDTAFDDKKLWSVVVPRVGHIHGRIGTAQNSQVGDPSDPFVANEKVAFELIWKKCSDELEKKGILNSSFTLEYGPIPYTPSHPFTGLPVSNVDQIILNELKNLNLVIKK